MKFVPPEECFGKCETQLFRVWLNIFVNMVVNMIKKLKSCMNVGTWFWFDWENDNNYQK